MNDLLTSVLSYIFGKRKRGDGDAPSDNNQASLSDPESGVEPSGNATEQVRKRTTTFVSVKTSRRIDNACVCGASITIAPYEYSLVWEFVGRGRYLQAAFCKSTAQLYSSKFDTFTANNLSNFAVKGAFLGLLRWSKDIGCRLDESVFTSGASGGSVEVLNWLLDNDCTLPTDAAPCTAAAAGGHVEALKFQRLCGLLGDESTFEAAAKNGHLNVLQFAHKFRCNCDMDRMFRIAVIWGHVHILQWMHETLQINDYWLKEACEAAVENGMVESLEWLRSIGCLPNANTCRNAIEEGQLGVLKWAIEAGCSWSVDGTCGREGETALHLASEHEHIDVIQFLIDSGANLNALTELGWTPMHSATFWAWGVK